jgi:hypothetical protein
MTALKSTALLCTLALAACENAHISGDTVTKLSISPSAVCNDNSAVMVDGEKWDRPKGTYHPISGGKHTISCKDGPTQDIDIKEKTSYEFSGWPAS